MKSYLAAFMLMCCVQVSQAEEFNLSGLLEQVSTRGSFEAKYKEKKYDPFFVAPTYAQGTVFFRYPDVVRKTVGVPPRQSFELDGNTITIDLSKEKKVFNADEQPDLKALFESFRAFFSGDKETLEKYYSTAFSGSEQDWELSLKPTISELRNRFRGMVFKGGNGKLLQVVTESPDGALSTMDFE